MRLRYLWVRGYPPLENVEIAFQRPSLPGRECAIRFVVGVNGSGKTHLLQAVAESFLALARQKRPRFPVTLVYELGERGSTRTVIFDSPGAARDVGWWVSASSAPPVESDGYGTEDWRYILGRVRDGVEGWEPLIRDANWPGAGVALPEAVLAYTTGSLVPWQALFFQEAAAAGMGVVAEDGPYPAAAERPVGWNRQRELDLQAAFSTDEARSEMSRLRQMAEEAIGREHDQTVCQLLDPVQLKLAVLAVSLRQAMEDHRRYDTAEAAASWILRIREYSDEGMGLRRLLSQIGWVWPVTVVLHVDFGPNAWGEREAMQKGSLMQALYLAASEVVREPEPSTLRRLFFDLKSKSTFDPFSVLSTGAMEEHLGGVSAFEVCGRCLASVPRRSGGLALRQLQDASRPAPARPPRRYAVRRAQGGCGRHSPFR